MSYRVIKQIVFETFDEINKTVKFEPEMELDYKRFFRIGKASYLQISCEDICIDGFIEGPDFDIENYVEPIPDITNFTSEEEKSINERFWEELRQQIDRTHREDQELPYTVQVEMRSSRIELNKYLKTIPGKNVIDIKPMENNCYLIIYKEYE